MDVMAGYNAVIRNYTHYYFIIIHKNAFHFISISLLCITNHYDQINRLYNTGTRLPHVMYIIPYNALIGYFIHTHIYIDYNALIRYYIPN